VKRRFRELLPVPGVELEVHTASGEVKTWVWTAPPPERLADGRYCLFTIANDITERNRVLAALRISEERYRLAAAAVDGIVYDWDLIAGRVERSPQIADLLGVPLHDIPEAAAWWSQRVHPDDLARIQGEAARVRGQGGTRYRCAYRVRHADGTWREVMDHAFLVCDARGAVVRVVGVTTDVTAQRRAEQALRDSEERLRLARDAARIGIHDFDVASGRIGWDARVRELWAVPADLPITYEIFIAGVHPEDRAGVQGAVEQALDPQGAGLYRAEYRVIGIGDGIERWVVATGQVSFADGKPIRLVGTVTDETARKAVEAKLRELIEQRDALLQEVHHRVKNNLQLIGSLLQVQAAQSGDPAVRDFAQRSASRIAAMGATYDILHRSPASGRIELGSYVRALCHELAASYLDAAGRLQVALSDEKLLVDSGKAVTLGLILNELVTNAFKHGLAPGAPDKIRVVLHRGPCGRWDLAVANGQAGRNTLAGPPTPGGKGLGLQLVALFVQQLGGTLEIRADDGYEVRLSFTPEA
jgi:PAS domain S-box-containing protein